MKHFTLKYASARCEYFAFPNPYLRIRMLCTLLYVLGCVAAVSIQLGLSYPSPNIPQLTSLILKSIRCISKIILQYLTKYLLLCLNGSIQANRHFAHTTILTYLVHLTHIQSTMIRLTTGIFCTTTIESCTIDSGFFGVGMPHLGVEALIAMSNKLLKHYSCNTMTGRFMLASLLSWASNSCPCKNHTANMNFFPPISG